MNTTSWNRREMLALAAAAQVRPGLAQIGDGGSFDSVKQLLQGKEPLTWVFTGDSITHGALHTMGWRSYVEIFAERVRFELRRSRDIVINTGISGNRMTGLVPDAEWRVYRFQPQVVSLMMGMNDCVAGPAGRETYRAELTKFLAMLIERKSLLLLHTPNPIVIIDPAKELRKDLPAYVDILRKFASDNAVPLIDHYQQWQETRKDLYSMIYVLNDANIHPNHFGHILLANLLFEKLGIFDPASRVCRMFIP
ncbi:MAG: SGNH/GDSL hydrolase family protein [Bryobacteraceae bacterium]